MSFETIKALHIIFMVCWFAGLFYIVRLFIYHTEAQQMEQVSCEILSRQYLIMERRLWWMITTPAMVLTAVFGLTMLLYPGHTYLIYQPWMHIKLGFVFVLLIYHFVCQKILLGMQRDQFRWTSQQLRLWNEVATLLLVAIVFIAITKGAMNWWKAVVVFIAIAVVFMILIRLYKRVRK